MANTLPDKLRNFSEHHHETLKISHKAKLEWWHNETVVKKERCARCWLRPWNCFCDQLEFKRLSRLANAQACGVNISIYYSHPEIGRSPNTAHVFEAICPTICSSFVYGEYEKERALLDSIEREHEEDTPCTCILYPSSDSITLSEWVARRNARNSELSNQPIRLVILDGTYPAASREAKYLVNCCRLRGINLPMVKLDLENGACKSAITGVMTQPSKDKICSYQAIVIALQQLGAGVGFCDDLHSDLQDWLTHILKTKVKLGKSQPRRSLRDVDNTPADYVKAILVIFILIVHGMFLCWA